MATSPGGAMANGGVGGASSSNGVGNVAPPIPSGSAHGSRHDIRAIKEEDDLSEFLGAYNAMVFKEDALSPVFCKPKLIPLKTVTMEKLEKMQEDALEKMRALDAKLKEDAKREEELSAAAAAERRDSEQGELAQADVWTADDDDPELGQSAL